MDFLDTSFWLALLKIAGVNILLSGDNAIVIALAARNLQAKQQKAAIFIGSAAAIVLRVILTIFAVRLLAYPALQLLGAVLLLWIGTKLLSDEQGDAQVKASPSLFSAIWTILLADLVMSLDNVIAVAGAANSAPEALRVPLLIIALATSIPLIIFGSTLLIKVMERFPIIVTLGAALLGFVAGEMIADDALLSPWVAKFGPIWHWGMSLLGALLVVLCGKWLAARSSRSIEVAG